ncbi:MULTISPECIES: hypothetical protein [unclassified Streptomyces]|uniref:Antitoxin n=1 Tax=Streptomyces sp. R33 TaxID=3238629 RepID=A0AB39Y6H1_9ACTN|nr:MULTISPECIES: hypothetical protein [unclassified Streptomyces]TDU77761.1 hypothetical protein EDD91_4522 [Streptomyces sp. KS 21]
MGIKDQFQDKAKELQDKARTAGRGAKDEASERGAHTPEPAKKKKEKVHDELDDNWDF